MDPIVILVDFHHSFIFCLKEFDLKSLPTSNREIKTLKVVLILLHMCGVAMIILPKLDLHGDGWKNKEFLSFISKKDGVTI
jgi:hypothetical protein